MSIPAVCFTGWSNSGKTTLIEGLVRLLSERGLRVGVIKHTHHPLPPDEDGKDSTRFAQAGAAAVMLSADEGALLREGGEHSLPELLSRIPNADIILVEGFEKQACLPMIEVWRDVSAPLRAPSQWLRAIVTDSPCTSPLPVFSPDQLSQIADFVIKTADEQRGQTDMQVRVCINGRDLSMVPFVQRMVENVNRGLLSALDGYSDGCEISIQIAHNRDCGR